MPAQPRPAALALLLFHPLPSLSANCRWVLLELGEAAVRVTDERSAETGCGPTLPAAEAAVAVYSVDDAETLHVSSLPVSPRRRHYDWASADRSAVRGSVLADSGPVAVTVSQAAASLVLLVREAGGVRHHSVALGERRPSATAADLPDPQMRVLQQVGRPDRQLNVAFLSAGYTLAEQEKFWGADGTGGDVRRAIDVLSSLTGHDPRQLSSQPWPRYWSTVNAYALWQPSAQSGASMPHGPGHVPAPSPHCASGRCEPYEVDNNLGCSYGTPHQKMLNCDWGRVFGVGQAAPLPALLIVLVNHPVYGGTGGWLQDSEVGGGAALPGIATVYTGDLMATLLVHEIGHALGHLSDEYSYGVTEKRELWDMINCSPKAGNVSWRGWIQNGGVDPTPSRVCSYDNYYRPTESDCLMARDAPRMCAVCSEQMVRSLYASRIDISAPRCPPEGEEVHLLPGQSVLLRVGTSPEAFSRTQTDVSLLWEVPAHLDDGRYTPKQLRQPDLEVSADGLGLGSHVITCVVRDETTAVLPQHRDAHMTHRAVFRVNVVSAELRRHSSGACPARRLRMNKAQEEESGLVLDGLFVLSVVGGSPAFYAGVQKGDVLREVAGKAVGTYGEAVRELLAAGGAFNVTVEREFRRCEGVGWADEPYCFRCEAGADCNASDWSTNTTPVDVVVDAEAEVTNAGKWVWAVGAGLLGTAVTALLLSFLCLRRWRQRHIQEVVVFSGAMRAVRRGLIVGSGAVGLGCSAVMVTCAHQYYSAVVYGKALILGGWVLSCFLFVLSFAAFASAYLRAVPGLVAAATSSALLCLGALGVGCAVLWVEDNIDSDTLKQQLQERWDDMVESSAERICTVQRYLTCSGFLHSCHNVGLALPSFCPPRCGVGNTYSDPCYTRLRDYVADNFKPAGAALCAAAAGLAAKTIAASVLAAAISSRRRAMRRRRRRRLCPESDASSDDSSEDERPLTDEELRLLRVEFAKSDIDGSGFLSLAELKSFWQCALGEEPPTQEALSEALSRMDTNGDGRISFDEFVAMYQPFDHRFAAAGGKVPGREGVVGTWFYGLDGQQSFSVCEEGSALVFCQAGKRSVMHTVTDGSGVEGFTPHWRTELTDGTVWVQHDRSSSVLRSVQRKNGTGELAETSAYPSRKSCLAAQGVFTDPQLSGQLTPGDRRWLRRQWRSLSSGAAVLSGRPQLRLWYERLHKRSPMADELDSFIRLMDTDRRGCVDFGGFCQPYRQMRRRRMEQLRRTLGVDELRALRTQFGAINVSGSCCLRSDSEMAGFYRAYHGRSPPTDRPAREAAFADLLRLADDSGDGRITFQEFCAPFARRARRQRKMRQGLDSERIAAIRAHYLNLDSGSDGRLTVAACRQLYETLYDEEPHDTALRGFVAELDLEQRGGVGFDELLRFFAETARSTAARRWMEGQGAGEEEVAATEHDFRVLGEMEDGLRMGVTRDGMATLLRSAARQLGVEPSSGEEVDKAFSTFDEDGDGFLDEIEFARAHFDRVITLWRAPPPPALAAAPVCDTEPLGPDQLQLLGPCAADPPSDLAAAPVPLGAVPGSAGEGAGMSPRTHSQQLPCFAPPPAPWSAAAMLRPAPPPGHGGPLRRLVQLQ